MELIAVIPARGGSKGLPRKNVLNLGGKPLLAYSIASALGAGVFDRVLVSTDDPEIADIAKAHGAEVPFLRPPELATDKARLDEVILHVLRGLYPERYLTKEQINISGVATCVLLPTSPFRSSALVARLAGKLRQGHCSVITVRRMEQRPGSMFHLDGDGLARPLGQRHPPSPVAGASFCRPYGLLHGFLPKGPLRPYLHLIRNPFSLIDIDGPEDFAVAEEIVRQGLFDFARD